MTGAWRLPDPVAVRVIENDWIVMPDGVRLALQLWLPDTPEPAPVVLEYIPYRKRDSTRAYSGYWGHQLAKHGVAYARLDARGSGDSEGLLLDEYLRQEQDDAVQAIAWLAAQPWCNGAVGMRGVSWGGFSTLQAAALNPPALKAIMPMCASDGRYSDDAHYIGGAFALTGLKWATSFKIVMAGPPDPAIFGPDWEAAWMQRLEATPAIAAEWLSHQREDDYWRQGSVAADYAAIRCPVYLVGGWVDSYNDAIPRLLQHLTVPTKALIGPWGHGYPAPASPGPGLQWAFEEVRWWRQWLMGEDTGVMDGPRLWAFMPEAAPAEVAPAPIPGRWVAQADWPPSTAPMILRLGVGRLSADHQGDGMIELESDPRVGLQTPEWVPFAAPEYPQEQSPDDERSLVFDCDPLDAPLELLGTPVARLRVSATRPVAKLAVRLTEVTPDGQSWLISYGLLNLTHRDSHASPQPLVPAQFYDIDLPLNVTARRLRPGSRIRLAISEGLWPLVWPSPKPTVLTIDLAHLSLSLPIREPDVEPDFQIPIAPPPRHSGRGDPSITRRVTENGWVEFAEAWPLGRGMIEDTGTAVERSGPNVELRIRTDEPVTCHWVARQMVRYSRDSWDCTLESEVEITADAEAFRVRERLTAKHGDRVVFNREHDNRVPRDLM